MTAEFSKLKNRSMEGICLPDIPPKCKWALETSKTDPHHHNPIRIAKAHESIVPSVLEAYGHTPLIKLNKIPQEEGIECDILVKCEFLNPGGSIKDRIAIRMIEEAEKAGHIKPGCTLIEPTSGNTGIGLALVAAIKGYRIILVMLDKNSMEKDVVLKALGAEIVRVPAAPFGTPDHYICIAHRLHREIPNSFIFDQYKNPWNAIAHYDTTGEEIITQTGGKVDMIVIGSGTCGTLTGIGRKVKEKVKNCKIIGVDPLGSVLAFPQELNEGSVKSYMVEGIGKKFLPAGYDKTVPDRWYKTGDKEGFEYARRLVRSEGVLCGGSSGSALAGAIKAVKDFDLKKGQKCVVILPDSIRNYMSRYINDDWMIDNGFMEVPDKLTTQWWWDKPISVLDVTPPPILSADSSCYDAVKTFKEEGIDYIPILGKQGELSGVVTMSDLTLKLSSASIDGSEPVSKAMMKKVEMLDVTSNLGLLSRTINREKFAIISKGDNPNPSKIRRARILGVVTGTDLLNYIASPPVQNGVHE